MEEMSEFPNEEMPKKSNVNRKTIIFFSIVIISLIASLFFQKNQK